MKILLIPIVLLLVTSVCYSQDLEAQWANNIKGSCRTGSISLDSEDNIYWFGEAYNGTELSNANAPILVTTIESGDALIYKMDELGNIIWHHVFGSISHEMVPRLTIDSNDNLYLAFNFRDTLFLDNTPMLNAPVGQGYSDGAIVKMNTGGEILWSNFYQGSDSDLIRSITVDSDNNILVAGTTNNEISTGSFVISNNDYITAFLFKMDTNGNEFWYKKISSSNYMSYQEVITDSGNNIYICGYGEGNLICDETYNLSFNTQGVNDGIIVKYNSEGEFDWLKVFGGENTQIANAIAIDYLGNIYCSGVYYRKFEVGDTLIQHAHQNYNGFLVKFNNDGDYMQAYAYMHEEQTSIVDLAVDSLGCVYYTGDFYRTLNLNIAGEPEHELYTGSGGALICKLGQNGEFHWGYMIDDSDNNSRRLYLKDDVLFLTGEFYQDVDVDLSDNEYNLNQPIGQPGSYIVKYKQNALSVEEQFPIETFQVYPNPATDVLNILSNYNKIELLSFNGCLLGTYKKQSTIDISKFPSGIYFINYIANTKTGTIKVIKY